MSTFPKTRIRIAADLFSYTAFGDALRATEDDYRPKFRAGDDIQFEIGLFNNGELLDITGIAAVTLEIKPLDTELTERFDEDDDADNYDLRGPDLSLTPIRSKTLPASDLNASLTKSAWDSNAPEQCHALITLSSAESNIASGDRWLTIGIVTGDSPGRVRTICAGPIRVLGGGLSQAASPEASTPETYYNTAEADARFLKLANNLSDLADASVSRNNLGLGASDSPIFAGLTVSSSGVVNFNDNRLRKVGDPSVDTDALNRRSADACYLQLAENGADIPDAAAFRTNLETYSRAEVDALAAKTFGPMLYLDGTTGAVTLPAAVGTVFSESSTVVMRLRLVDGRPATIGCLLGYSSGTVSGTSFQLLLNINGSLKLLLRDGTSEASTQTAVLFADGPGREVIIVVVIDRATGLAMLYRDGKPVASLDISALDLEAGTWGAPALGALLSGATLDMRLAACLSAIAIFNRALSASEVAERFGPQPTVPSVPVDDRWGLPDENLFSNPGFENYAGGTFTDWGTFVQGGSTITVEEMDAYTGTRAARFNIDAANSYAELITSANVVTAGGRYRTTFWAKGTAGSNLSLYTGGTSMGFVTLAQTWTRYTLEFTASASGKLSFRRSGSVAPRTMLLDEVRLQRIGTVVSYSVAQNARMGYQLHDASANALHGLLSTTGCTWLEAGERGRLMFTGFTADAWLGGSERALLPAGYRVAEIIATETAGVAVSNLALGTTADGTDLVSSFSLHSGETKTLAVDSPFTAKSAAKPIHLNDAPGGPWGGARVSLTFLLEKL